ncbi:IS110 family transposase [Deinococcus peraridilitoris]|uniref:Transposase n=1 Tax=Deinococcus peraridilitoris (strain DSM 19664 / LMG 22246 / CIP 109416 / KR-200) TaxID=937777 RepID=L0A9H8_DEIPD|nr:IS110 family transposase [Deinococcus peraridilitoris]AFZ69787.1 transposase [Deinococcus peraridilitoris DSM 19664]
MFVLGIDVGKSDLYARLLRVPVDGSFVPVDRVRIFPNTLLGHQQLFRWLQRQSLHSSDTTVVMEATGVYWERIATHLHTAGFTVCVVNAAQIKFFAKSTLRRGKTDKMDAELIARYGATMKPAPWSPPTEETETLRDLLHERDAVVELITLEKGRHHALDHRRQADQLVVALCEARLALLEEQLSQVNQAIKGTLAVQDEFHTQVELLCTVPGIGPLTAAIMLSETKHLSTMDSSQQWAAYAGLSPVPRQSGAMVGKCRISKIGNSRLRRAMYLSAVTTSRLQNPLGDFYRRLVAAGKPKKVALIALARKLLRVSFAVLKTGRHFLQGEGRQGEAAVVTAASP